MKKLPKALKNQLIIESFLSPVTYGNMMRMIGEGLERNDMETDIGKDTTKDHESETSKQHVTSVFTPTYDERNANRWMDMKYRNPQEDFPYTNYEPVELGGKESDERAYKWKWTGNFDVNDIDDSLPLDVMFHINSGDILYVDYKFYKALRNGWKKLDDSKYNMLRIKLDWFCDKDGKSLGEEWSEMSFLDDMAKEGSEADSIKEKNLIKKGEAIPRGAVVLSVRGEVEIWRNRESAVKYYETAIGQTDGSERESYEDAIKSIRQLG